MSRRTVRNWIKAARERVVDQHLDIANIYNAVTKHNLRGPWAMLIYYTLALAGVPIAEQFVVFIGEWAQSESGLDTFRNHHFGTVPITPLSGLSSICFSGSKR